MNIKGKRVRYPAKSSGKKQHSRCVRFSTCSGAKKKASIQYQHAAIKWNSDDKMQRQLNTHTCANGPKGNKPIPVERAHKFVLLR